MFLSSSYIFSYKNWRRGGLNKFFPMGRAGTSGKGEVLGKG
jgi:hypothetical protein